ncbi:MAG: hypothetical protein ACRD4O_19325 [Bryobacteraceae bacterium]
MVKTNPVYKNLMIIDAGKWYALPQGSTFQDGARVNYEEWVRSNPPPGLYYAKDVKLATGIMLLRKGTVKPNPFYKQLMIFGDDGNWFALPQGSTFGDGAKVTFQEWVRLDAPPGFLYAEDVKAATGAGLWSTFKFSATPDPGVPAPTHLIPDKNSTSSPSASGGASKPPRIINDKTALQDYDEIMKSVQRMNWSGKFGPSVRVETKLKWENAACRELYLKVKEELHDSRIPGTKLFYYVGGIGNWGKAGFRISGHTKTADKAGDSETNGVLHVENG